MNFGRVKTNILTTVVQIKSSGGGIAPSTGTGFIVSKIISPQHPEQRRFFLVTNKHVLGDWNHVDQDLVNYYKTLEVGFYLNTEENGVKYKYFPIELLDQNNQLNKSITIHSVPIVDVGVIELDLGILPNARIDSFDISYLSPFNKILKTGTGIGDQVFAIGYPYGITSIKNNYPVAKSLYIASLPGEEFGIDLKAKDRTGQESLIRIEGKIIVTDGLIVGGNSGGPIIIPSETKVRINPDTGAFEHAKNESVNLIIGIVSTGLGSSGINLAFSSDYILELLQK